MASLAGADAYFLGTLKADAWDAHENADKQAALKEAGRTLAALDLSAPRQPNLDWATYEQAYCLLETTEETREQQRNIAMGLTAVTVDKHSESYGDASSVAGLVDGVWICPEALRWIAAYRRPRRVRTGRLQWERGRGCV